MGDVMTERLLHERAQNEAKIASLKAVAVDQNRDLSPVDVESLKAYSERIRTIDGQLEATVENVAMSQAIQDRIALVSGPAAVTGHQYRSAGELLWDALHRHSDGDARARYENVQRRAAQHMGTSADATVAVAGGFGGLAVSGPVGPIIDLYPKGRPWLTAIGVQDAPNAFSFMRPRIIDPDFYTAAQPQTLEKQELASKKFDVGADTLRLTTVGNYLNLSRQAEDFIPQALNIVTNQLLARLAVAEEKALATEAALTTAKVTLAADADGAAVRAAIFEAAALVFENTGALPEWVAMGPAGWARLGSLVDLAHRPLFPFSNDVNALGTMSPSTFTISGLGLTGIVTPGITDGAYYVGNSLSIEAYEHRYPVLDAIEPSLLGRQIAVAASVVIYRPTTAESPDGGVTPAEANGVVKIAP
jgi:hypothetical protein